MLLGIFPLTSNHSGSLIGKARWLIPYLAIVKIVLGGKSRLLTIADSRKELIRFLSQGSSHLPQQIRASNRLGDESFRAHSKDFPLDVFTGIGGNEDNRNCRCLG